MASFTGGGWGVNWNRLLCMAAVVGTLGLVCVGLAKANDPAGGGDQGGGSAELSGQVLFQGPKPKLKRINMSADPNCARHSAKQKVYSDTLVVGEEGKLKNVLVWVQEGLGSQKHPAPQTPVVVTQLGCMYDPHIFGVMAGQPVTIRNDDPTLHNVHGFAKINPSFNFAQPVQGMENKLVFDKLESFVIKCDVHPWMMTHCRVFSHPYFAVTDEDGRFTIPHLPPGQYTVQAWHEQLGEKTLTVTIGQQEKKEVQFTFESKAGAKDKGNKDKNTNKDKK